MSEPSFAFHQGIYDALIGSGVAGGRVFHRVPDKTPRPYIYIGADDISEDQSDSVPMWDCIAEIHAFADSMKTLKQVVGEIYTAVKIKLPLVGFKVDEIGEFSVNFVTGPDGASEHAVISIEYRVQELAG